MYGCILIEIVVFGFLPAAREKVAHLGLRTSAGVRDNTMAVIHAHTLEIMN